MKVNEVITEGRDAPLYHGTSLKNASKIMKTFVIRGDTIHCIEDKSVPGVSLTRSRKYALWWAIQEFGTKQAVAFEFDQAALSARYRIIPFDIYGDGFMGPELTRRETEEFLVGSINLSRVRCLRTIWVHPDVKIPKTSPLANNSLVRVMSL